MAGQQPRPVVVPSAGDRADHDSNGLAGKKIILREGRITERQRYENDRRRDSYDGHRKLVTSAYVAPRARCIPYRPPSLRMKRRICCRKPGRNNASAEVSREWRS